jgi:hydrogenase maturation protease
MRDTFFDFDSTPVTIVGLGSPFGDDRIGWCVADALARQLPAAAARIVKLDRPATGLLDEIAGRRRALLVDAAVDGASPGTLHSLPLEALSAADTAASSHALGVAEALALGWSLGVLPTELRLYLVSIDPLQTRPGVQELTPAVAAAVEPLTDCIRRRVAGCPA